MNAKRIGIFLSLFILLFTAHETKPLIIGSDSAASIQSYVVFPEADLDNTVLSFAWMQNGFALQTSNTNLLFKSVFPVLGTVDLAGGTLNLDQDFLFRNVSVLNGLGTIYANGHTIGFCSSITQLPANTMHFDTANISLEGGVQLQSVVNFSGICTINGNNNGLDLTNGALVIDSNSSLRLSNLDLWGIDEGAIYCVDDSASLILDNVKWIQDDSITFSLGTMTIDDEVVFCGAGTFYLSTQLTNTINDVSTWKFTNDLSVVMGRNPISNTEPLYFQSDRSTLYLDDVAFQCTATGMSLTNGTLMFNRNVSLDFLGSTTQTGVILGNGNIDNDIHVILNPGTTVDLVAGYWVYNNGSPTNLKSNSPSATLIRQEESYIYIAQSLVLSNCTVDITSDYVLPIVVASGALLSYNNCVVVLPSVQLDIQANQVDAFTYQLDGNNSLFFTRGTLPFAILVTNQGNAIKGNGSITGPVIFSDGNAQLLLDINGLVQNSVTLNNGTLTLNAPLILSTEGIITGPGTIDLSTYTAQLSRTVNVWPSSVEWLDALGEVQLFGTLSLLDTWTFTGNLTLNGNGNTLDLSQGGALLANTNSNLILKNIQITGVNNNNIACLDNSSTLVFDNVTLVLDGNYSFTQGSISFMNDTMLTGSYNFAYETIFTSTIASAATLSCMGSINFQLGKSSPTTTIQPLIFTDKTSTMVLDQSTLNVQLYGYQMTKGTLVSNRSNVFAIQSTNTSNGLTIGDGTLIGDMTIQLNPGSQLTLSKGHLNYNLQNPIQGIIGQSQTAQLIIGSTFITHFISSANISNITYVINPPGNFTQDPGAQVMFTNILAVTPIGTFNVTGTRVSTTQIALNGNNQLQVLSGQFPSILSVSGTGNTLSGVGTVSGVVTLANSATVLTSALAGQYLQTIILNGGTLALGATHQLGNNVVLTGPGTVNMGAQTLALGYNTASWATPLLWQGTAATLAFHSNISLQSTWTFAGHVLIQGNNFELDLSNPNAQIVLANNATLTLDGLRIKNLSGTKITCLGNNSVVVFDNTRVILNDDYAFTTGAIQYNHDNEILGDYVFAYQSQMTSTLFQDSHLQLAQDVTFSYDPISGAQDLFEFIDDSSVLILNNATLQATAGGMQLTQGTMRVQNDSYLQCVTGLPNTGIILGDGINPYNDFSVHIYSGVTLNVQQGSLILNNLNPSAINFINAVSTLHMYSYTSLLAYQNISFPTGRIIFEDQSTLATVSGNTFSASISPLGTLYRVNLTPS